MLLAPHPLADDGVGVTNLGAVQFEPLIFGHANLVTSHGIANACDARFSARPSWTMAFEVHEQEPSVSSTKVAAAALNSWGVPGRLARSEGARAFIFTR